MAGENFPAWLRGRLTSADAKAIEDAVRAAEERSDLEIVPMIVHRSSAVGHVPIVTALMMMLTGAVFLIAWRDHWLDHHMLIAVFAGAVACALAAWPLSKSHAVQRWAVPDADEILQVQRRASAEFALHKISGARNRRGVMLFVSVMERRAVILPDDGLLAKLTPEACTALVETMAAELRQGNWGAAFANVIARIPDLVGGAAPQGAGTLSNQLIIRD